MKDLIWKIHDMELRHPRKKRSPESWANIRSQIEKDGYYTITPRENMPLVDVCLHSPAVSDPDRVALHRHDFFEMLYVYRGCCLNLTRDHQILLQQGDLLLLNPNAIHAPCTRSQDDCVINILMQKSIFHQTVLSMQNSNNLISSFLVNYICQSDQKLDYIYFPFREEYSIDLLIEQLICELNHQELYYESMIQSILISLFATMSRIYCTSLDSSQQSFSKSQLITKIINHISNNLSTVSLRELSETFNYSMSYLSRFIRNQTGKSFLEITQDLRLEKAKQYLEAGTLSVEKIACLVGYNDVSYLHNVFKSHYGISPARYRQSCKKAYT